MSKKTALHFKFESLTVHVLENFTWNEELELYEDERTQICWFIFISAIEGFTLENDCMIEQTWFMKGTPVANLIKHAEDVYKAEVAAQNSKIKFGTDDNQQWFAHDVPFFITVQIDRIEEHGLVEWDIHFNECWQGPFNSKQRCIQHLEECIAEKRQEAKEG
ncbi:hypothetical protein FY048_17875 [Acinetobacter sp. 1124_18A]|uniref:hypothetical protein n=1 Tax=Acinetobacter sp. 1124_18A TaxID=2605958 RepID=UPI00405933FB